MKSNTLSAIEQQLGDIQSEVNEVTVELIRHYNDLEPIKQALREAHRQLLLARQLIGIAAEKQP